jgi:hypothetical protein
MLFEGSLNNSKYHFFIRVMTNSDKIVFEGYKVINKNDLVERIRMCDPMYVNKHQG